ncbi:hypothetical protein MA16_Dca018019 [Dendrobium catenatum]|uniref:Uncharacterized protein n=1 Tax=Dendrobium catenatum TaxID=906689 RepID=A0A2I0WPD5_9ASPA|nr:hypothetical protein MA16_Dca018019 [Dendrobium catenatum]
MAEAIGRALDWVGCLGGGDTRRTKHYYNYYAPNTTSSIMGKGKGRPLSLQVIFLFMLPALNLI